MKRILTSAALSLTLILTLAAPVTFAGQRLRWVLENSFHLAVAAKTVSIRRIDLPAVLQRFADLLLSELGDF